MLLTMLPTWGGGRSSSSRGVGWGGVGWGWRGAAWAGRGAQGLGGFYAGVRPFVSMDGLAG